MVRPLLLPLPLSLLLIRLQLLTVFFNRVKLSPVQILIQEKSDYVAILYDALLPCFD